MFGQYEESKLRCVECGASGVAYESLVHAGALSLVWNKPGYAASQAWPRGQPLPDRCLTCQRPGD